MIRWASSKVVMPPVRNVEMNRAIAVALISGAQKLKARIIELIEPHKKTGDLAKSWHLIKGGDKEIIIYSDDPASVYLDKGTKKPHGTGVIEPKAGRPSRSQHRIISTKGLRGKAKSRAERHNRLYASALKFEIAAVPFSGAYASVPTLPGETDRIIVARVKNHPGTKGIHYIMQAEEEMLPQILADIENEIYKAIEQASPVFVPFPGAALSARTGRYYYGQRGAGGKFIPRSR